MTTIPFTLLALLDQAATPKPKPRRRKEGSLDKLATKLIHKIKVDRIYLIGYMSLVEEPPVGLNQSEHRQIMDGRIAKVKRALGCRLRLKAEHKFRETADGYKGARLIPISQYSLDTYSGIPTLRNLVRQVERRVIPRNSTLLREVVTEAWRCCCRAGDKTAVALYCVIPGINQNEEQGWLWTLYGIRDVTMANRHLAAVLERMDRDTHSGLYNDSEAQRLNSLIQFTQARQLT